MNFWVFGILLLIPMLSKLVHFLLTPSDVETTIQKTRKVLRNLGNFTVQIALLLIALVFVLANYFQIHHWLVSKLSYEVVSSIGEFLEKTFSTSSVLAIFRTLVSVVFNLVIFNVVPFFACACFVKALDWINERRVTFVKKVDCFSNTQNYSSFTSSHRNLFLELNHFIS
ncbi:MAG: hypothetical protein J6R37_00425 [Clostridia bacterium]|nr:hypothetical protein [Clostridia bacterium]